MRKVISLSGLLAGLLAVPGFAAPPVMRPPGDEVAGPVGISSAEILPERKLTDDEIGRLQGALVDIAEKGPLDIGGMIAIQRRLAEEVQSHLAGAMLADAGAADIPAALAAAQDPAPRPARRTEKAAFLGVTASRVDPTLRAQLQLEKGMGLIVDFVAAHSPAQAAGLQPHDVLVKFEDQKLVNLEQLAVLVRSKKAGDEVMLSIIRGGKPAIVTATLQERELPALDDARTFQLPEQMMLHFDGQGGWRVGQRIKVVNNPDGSTARTMTDDTNTIELTRSSRGKHTLVVRDTTGKEIYRGGWDSAEEKKKVPAELEPKVESLAATRESADISGGPNGMVVQFGDNLMHADVLNIERKDAAHDIVVTLRKQGRSVVVKDAKTGKVIYEGPANTQDDFKKMPADVAEIIRANGSAGEVIAGTSFC